MWLGLNIPYSGFPFIEEDRFASNLSRAVLYVTQFGLIDSSLRSYMYTEEVWQTMVQSFSFKSYDALIFGI